jgi:hypothetical protein
VCLRFGRGHPDRLQIRARLAVQTLGQLVDDVGALMKPAPLRTTLREDFGHRLPEA